MSERGIIMAADSVQAILAGLKTQTRRVAKQFHANACLVKVARESGLWCSWERCYDDAPPTPLDYDIRCPYGARLWVKEAFAVVRLFPGGHGDYGEQRVTGPLGGDRDDYRVIYAADEREDGPWRSPIYIPRWASRLTLEVVEVRVQRVQDISGEDALAEGCPGDDHGLRTDRPRGDLAVAEYAAGWDALNAKRGFPWASNPWVWAVTFKRVEAV